MRSHGWNGVRMEWGTPFSDTNCTFGDGWMVYEFGLNHREDSQNVHWWILQGLYHQFSGEIGDDLLITKFTSLPH